MTTRQTRSRRPGPDSPGQGIVSRICLINTRVKGPAQAREAGTIDSPKVICHKFFSLEKGDSSDMRKMTLSGMVAVSLACLAFSVPASAQPYQHPGLQPDIPMAGMQAAEPDGTKAREAVVQFLGLAPDQANAWEGLLATRKSMVEPLREDLQAAEKELQQLLQRDKPDPAAVGSLVLRTKDLREQIASANKAYLDGFEAMLTAEQKNKLAFLRRAERAAPLFPAFRLFGLLPPPAAGPGAQR